MNCILVLATHKYLSKLLFKPYIIGIEQAGIIEIISQLSKNMSNDTQINLAKNIEINTIYFLRD